MLRPPGTGYQRGATDRVPVCPSGDRFRIIRKTAKRIFYSRKPIPPEDPNALIAIQVYDPLEKVVGSIDRWKIEHEGRAWAGSARPFSGHAGYLYLVPQPRLTEEEMLGMPPCCMDRADWRRELGGVGRRLLP